MMQLYEAMYPETAWGKALKNNGETKVAKSATFSDSAAAKTGLTSRSIRRLISIGRLPDAIKDMVRGTLLADEHNELLKLSRIKYEQDQRDAVARLPSQDAEGQVRDCRWCNRSARRVSRCSLL